MLERLIVSDVLHMPSVQNSQIYDRHLQTVRRINYLSRDWCGRPEAQHILSKDPLVNSEQQPELNQTSAKTNKSD